MVESKKKRNARLKAMRKKFGLGEFRKSKRTVKKRKVRTMARRRVRRRSSSRRTKARRSRRSSGMNLLGFNVQRLALLGAGSGVAGVVGATTNQITGGRLSGNVAQLGGALVVKKAGNMLRMSKFTNPIADGIVIKTVGDFVEDNVAPQLAGALGGVTNRSSSSGGIQVI